MTIDLSDPEAARLYVAQIEDRQACLLRLIEERDEGDRKRRRLHNGEVTSLRQNMNAVVQESKRLKLETEESPLLKYIKISQKTFRTKLVVEDNHNDEQQGPL
ncbi:hypothetical protein E4U59_001875 [Claviceps monticola]|nr:hypothetical protein E4U59_001875 [Claviceps monticola]